MLQVFQGRLYRQTSANAAPSSLARKRLVALGAVRLRLLPADGVDESCLVMQDVEGNEFCLD